MLAEVMLTDYAAETFADIDDAIEVEDNMVVFHLLSPSSFFLKIIALPFCGIVDKETVIELGGWPGTAETWPDYADQPLEDSVLSNTIVGTGPFIVESWTPGVEATFVRNEDYWREPAALERVVLQRVDEWTTRRLMLANGDADIVDVPQPYLEQVEAMDGVRVIRGLPLYTIWAVFLTRDIDMVDNPFVGSGQLDGEGIPSDFFNDLDVRKGFNYAFDTETYIDDVMEGAAIEPATCIPSGMAYYDPDLEPYPYDTGLAAEHLKAALDGDVWEEGFEFTIAWVSGEAEGKAAAEVLELGLEMLNPNFQVDLQPMQLAEFMDEFMANRIPAFVWAWTADYLDPHNFAQPFMHSTGFYSASQNITGYDELVMRGVSMADGPEREALYQEIQQTCFDDALSIFMAQPSAWHVEREWVKGWYQFIPQWNLQYYYPLSKSAE
jgi:peptide/nickel transport system substrate-binding protein